MDNDKLVEVNSLFEEVAKQDGFYSRKLMEEIAGKGSIKEKFSKINGVLNGEYFQYNRNGTFNIKTYIDGVIPLTELEIKSKNLKEEWNKSINDEIRKLKIIDDLISEISGIFLLVQMENSKIDYYSKFSCKGL
jgi:hypothetical protein